MKTSTIFALVVMTFCLSAFAESGQMEASEDAPVAVETIFATINSLCSFSSASGCSVKAIGHQCTKDGHFGACSPSGEKDNNNHAICVCYTGY